MGSGKRRVSQVSSMLVSLTQSLHLRKTTPDNSPTFVHFLHTFTIRTLSLSQSNFSIYLFVTKMPPTIRGTNNKKESPPPKKNIEPAKKN
ncbi:hypothetical protein YC2023_039298 [Brassica napus]